MPEFGGLSHCCRLKDYDFEIILSRISILKKKLPVVSYGCWLKEYSSLMDKVANPEKVKIAIIGLGSIGRKHLEVILASECADLVAISDKNQKVKIEAEKLSVPFYVDFNEMLNDVSPDGVIIATPTETHLLPALSCLEAGADLLIEKPITSTLCEANQIIEKASVMHCKVLVGHHRRFYPVLQNLKDFLSENELGKLVAVYGQWTTLKPKDYFSPPWRRKRSAGPILTNLIHEIDTLRFVCGEIKSITAEITNSIRGFDKEDSAAIILCFKSGVIGNFLLSDGAASPWTWEAATGENPAFPGAFVNTHRFCCTNGAVEFPKLKIWSEVSKGQGWNSILKQKQLEVPFVDAYVFQLRHFCNVIQRIEEPITNGEDAKKTLKATVAVFNSAKTGSRINL